MGTVCVCSYLPFLPPSSFFASLMHRPQSSPLPTLSLDYATALTSSSLLFSPSAYCPGFPCHQLVNLLLVCLVVQIGSLVLLERISSLRRAESVHVIQLRIAEGKIEKQKKKKKADKWARTEKKNNDTDMKGLK